MDQLIRLDAIRHATNDRFVHVKHIQQEQIGTLTGCQLGIRNSKQQGLHCTNGFTDDNAPLTCTQSIKQVLFGNREQLRGTTIQVTLMHTFSFQVPAAPASATVYGSIHLPSPPLFFVLFYRWYDLRCKWSGLPSTHHSRRPPKVVRRRFCTAGTLPTSDEWMAVGFCHSACHG